MWGAISAEDIISIIQSEIENFDVDNTSEETGTVIYVGDGIVTVYGIDHAMYGEVVVFGNGVKRNGSGYPSERDWCNLFGRDTGIKEGTKVVRTKKKAGIPVGNEYIGRVINALGECQLTAAQRLRQMVIVRLRKKHLVSLRESQ